MKENSLTQFASNHKKELTAILGATALAGVATTEVKAQYFTAEQVWQAQMQQYWADCINSGNFLAPDGLCYSAPGYNYFVNRVAIPQTLVVLPASYTNVNIVRRDFGIYRNHPMYQTFREFRHSHPFTQRRDYDRPRYPQHTGGDYGPGRDRNFPPRSDSHNYPPNWHR